MRFIKNNYLIIFIVLLGTVLRLWNISSNPPHLTPDEAALGYNAYSLMQSGRDEHGQLLPIIFKSFGDYKPGLYIYLTIPFIWVFGLTEFAVRLPSAFAGITAVYLLFLITNKLFRDKNLALISAALLAVNPWSVHFSRSAWEVNLALCLTLAAIYFFLLALKKQKYLYLSAVFFGSTLLAYQGAKLSSSLVLLILLILHHKKIFKFNRKILAGSFWAGFLMALPVLLSFLTGKTGRLTVFSVFSYPRPKDYLAAFLSQAEVSKNSLIYYIFYSEPLNFLRGILGRYFNHFSTRFLFFVGDWQNVRHTPPYHGTMLLADLPFLVLGLFAIFKDRLKKAHWFFVIWLIVAPLPSALSRDQVHAVRALNMLVPLVFVSAFGINFILKNFRKAAIVLTCALYSLSVIYFLDAEFIHLPKAQSKFWEYGYKQIVHEISPIQGNYQEVVLQQSYAQPYIYFLFFQKYPPGEFQKENSFVESKFGDVGQVSELKNIKFEPIDWSIRRGQKGKLFVADPVRIPLADINLNEHKIISEIKYLDGEVAFRLVEVKDE